MNFNFNSKNQVINKILIDTIVSLIYSAIIKNLTVSLFAICFSQNKN